MESLGLKPRVVQSEFITILKLCEIWIVDGG